MEGLWRKAHHSSIALEWVGFLNQGYMTPWGCSVHALKVLVTNQSPDHLLRPENTLSYMLRSVPTLPTFPSSQSQRWWQQEDSVETLSALVLPFVVEYDANDNGKHKKYQREKDNKEEGQPTQGWQWGCHLRQLHVIH